MSFDKFTSIESFAHVTKYAYRDMFPPTVRYIGKIKLHGTNAGIRIGRDGSVVAQSRSRDLTLSDDNAGFAAWVERHKSQFLSKFDPNDMDWDYTTIYGEWAGKGIQKTDAVTMLNQKYFFVFAIKYGNTMESDPVFIERAIPDIDTMLVIPTFEEVTLKFSKEEELHSFVEKVTNKVSSIANVDPFIYEIFGVEGPGEGLVYAPINVNGEEFLERDLYSKFIFKVKSEAHGAKKAKVASVALEIPENIQNFVEIFVTEARCEQGLTEGCNGVAEKSQTSNFLKWLGNDVRKESVAELEEMGLEWKAVAGLVSKAGAKWFINRCDMI